MILRTKSGKPLHPMGIGTWEICSRKNSEDLSGKYGGVEPVRGNEDQEIEAIRYSLAQGQNHLDCAELYGGFYTDEVIGRAIAGFSREDLYIADKLWKTSLGEGQVRPVVEQMLTKLGTDYLDLLYIHSPWSDPRWQESVPQIDELIEEGIVGQFGVSNFDIYQLREAMSLASHPVAANQLKVNVLHTSEVDRELEDFCARHDVKIVAYQPIKRGEVLENHTVRALAQARNATPAQIALAWLLHKDMLPIPKATNKTHIEENLKALELKLTDLEIRQLAGL